MASAAVAIPSGRGNGQEMKIIQANGQEEGPLEIKRYFCPNP
jgi:hypothetical protein